MYNNNVVCVFNKKLIIKYEDIYNDLNRGLNIETVGVSIYKKEYDNVVIEIIKVDNSSISINMK